MDGCLIMEGPAADWILSRSGFGDLIVELKGRDVGHALVQTQSTLEDWSGHAEREAGSRFAVLIVCAAQKPQISPQRQRAERRFRRDLCCQACDPFW